MISRSNPVTQKTRSLDDTSEENPPILVTGAHRSGTTWAATMLGLASNTLLTEEPMNVRPHRYAFDGLADNYFTYAPELPEEDAIRAFQKIISRSTGKVFSRKTPQRYFKWARQGRYIIKDPIACLSSNWLAQHFDLNVLLLIRHPGAFTASLKRMNWKPDLSIFLNQRRFSEKYLSDMKDLILGRKLNFSEAAAITWKIIYRTLHEYSFHHPEWILVTHEDLALDPLKEFQRIYKAFNLPWTPEVSAGISQFTSSDNQVEATEGSLHTLKRDSRSIVNSWKQKFSDQEIETIKTLTSPEWQYWYKEDSWN